MKESKSNQPTDPAPMQYVKLPISHLEDPSYGNLPDSAKARLYDLTMLAGRYPHGGSFIKNGAQMSREEIAWALRIDPEQLNKDIDILIERKLVHENGRGLELSNWKTEQADIEKIRQGIKERVNKYRNGSVTRYNHVTNNTVTGDKHVNNPAVTLSQSQSQSQSHSKSKSHSNKSADADDTHQTITKIIKHCGIPNKYHRDLLDHLGITREHILSMLAYNYSKSGDGPGKVRAPAIVTAINLINDEHAPAEFYQPGLWTRYLPSALAIALGLSIQSNDEQEEKVSINGYTNCDEQVKDPVWEKLLGLIKLDTSHPIFVKHFQPTNLVGIADGIYTISVPNAGEIEWLKDRGAKTISRLLAGICNTPDPQLRFIVEGQ
jgi:hypothetical protein